MNGLSDDCLKAEYRPNKSSGPRTGSSTLVWKLRKEEWVPQIENDKKSFVKPSEAVVELLPKGFSYQARAPWLEAVEFGKSWQDREEKERRRKEQATQEYQRKEETAKSFGFTSYERSQELARIDNENPEMIDELIRKQEAEKQRPIFPEKKSNNPDRRQEKVKEQHVNAPEKEYEKRERSVRLGGIDHKTALKEQYTNNSGEMVCQICKKEMPFKKRDGEYYFEAVEALSKDYLPKAYEAHIALCPLCEAMYKEFVKSDKEAMAALHCALKNSDDLEVPLELGELATSIRFVETHRRDMKTILQNRA